MKNTVALAISASLLSASLSAIADTEGGSGTIHFTGSIIDAPCSIAPESIDQTVELGIVTKKAFKKVGDHSTAATGEIKLVDCDLSNGTEAPFSKVSITFTGTADTTVKDLLRNDADAQGVGVRLMDKEGKSIALNTAQEYPLSNSPVIAYQAYMESTAADVTVGDVKADVTFKLTYK